MHVINAFKEVQRYKTQLDQYTDLAETYSEIDILQDLRKNTYDKNIYTNMRFMGN